MQDGTTGEWTLLPQILFNQTVYTWYIYQLLRHSFNEFQATGMYTNSWDPNNGQILISTDYGSTFNVSSLPFKA